jgi:hypothetical protein
MLKGGTGGGGGGGRRRRRGYLLSVSVGVKYLLPWAVIDSAVFAPSRNPQMNPTVFQPPVPVTTVPHTLPQSSVQFYNFVSPLTRHPIKKCKYIS